MQGLAFKVNARSKEIKSAEARVKQVSLHMKKASEEQGAQNHTVFNDVGLPSEFIGPACMPNQISISLFF